MTTDASGQERSIAEVCFPVDRCATRVLTLSTRGNRGGWLSKAEPARVDDCLGSSRGMICGFIASPSTTIRAISILISIGAVRGNDTVSTLQGP